MKFCLACLCVSPTLALSTPCTISAYQETDLHPIRGNAVVLRCLKAVGVYFDLIYRVHTLYRML